MSDYNLPATPGHAGGGGANTGKTEAAKSEATELASTAQHEGKRVMDTAKSEARSVAHDAKSEMHDLYDETRRELTDQASAQQERVASGLRALSEEFQSMANNADEPGMATDLVRQASDRAESMAFWLDNRTPGGVLDEVKSYARRKPGTFIAAAAVAGLLAGRLTKALTSDTGGSSQGGMSSGGGASPSGSYGRLQPSASSGALPPEHGSSLPTVDQGGAGTLPHQTTPDYSAGQHAAGGTGASTTGAGASAGTGGTSDMTGTAPTADGITPHPETPMDPSRIREDLR